MSSAALFLLLLLPPLVAATIAVAVRDYTPAVGWAGAGLSLAPLGAALALAGRAAGGASPAVFGPDELLRVDALSALVLCCVAGATSAVLFAAPGLGRRSEYAPSQLRRFHVVIHLFVLVMLVAVTVNNLGFMWIAVEATTITSALLVPLVVSKESVEASWKYILIGSVGIALAFLGTVIAYSNFVALAGRAENAMNWSALVANASALKPDVMRLAFAFLLVGFGTKAGVVPVHTWKPDTYSQSPPALAALMSSGLFAVAVYAIIRWKVVVDAATGGRAFTGSVLVGVGLVSLALGAFSLVIQRNYKRMLAYSSIEHAGLVCLGLGLGPLGAFAAFLHLVNHTAAKSSLFLVAGEIERTYGSPRIEDVRGLLRHAPWTGALFAACLLALIGIPPFGVFVSEFTLFRAGFAAGQYWATGIALGLLAVAFLSLIGHLNRMLYGDAPDGVGPHGGEPWARVPVVVGVGILAVLGLAIPGPLVALLHNVARIVAP